MTATTTATADAHANVAKTAPPATPLHRPALWCPLDNHSGLDPLLPSSLRILRDVVLSYLPPSTPPPANSDAVVVILGAGCLWHIEATLRRLPGVIDTEAGYAGGMTGIGENYNTIGTTTTTARTPGTSPPSPPPYYKTVCGGKTGHAETVRLTLDEELLNQRTLFDCFLSLHDPTKVRYPIRQAAGTGQYCSCVFVPTSRGKDGAATATKDYDIVAAAIEAVEECQ